LTGIWGALTGYLIASAAKDQKNGFGWLVASVLLPVGLETGYFVTVSSLMVLLVILASVFVLAIYNKKSTET
jgi:RsiW-degrading membrane proteinase PrsW (M82 family)